jgi:hypothetical protein
LIIFESITGQYYVKKWKGFGIDGLVARDIIGCMERTWEGTLLLGVVRNT